MLLHPNPYCSLAPPPETVVWVKSDGEALARVSAVADGRITVSSAADSHGFVKVTRQGSLTLEELQNEFGISSVLECDSTGTMLSRTMVMDSPAQILARGKHYVVRKDHNDAIAMTKTDGRGTNNHFYGNGAKDYDRLNHSPVMASLGQPLLGDKRDRLGGAMTNDKENTNTQSNRKKGVTFQSKVFVKEYNIGHTIDGNSQSFNLASSEPPSHGGPRPPPLLGRHPTNGQNLSAAANGGNQVGRTVVASSKSSGPVPADWQWTDVSAFIGTHNNEVCRVHHLVDPKRSAAVAALMAEVNAFLAPYMEKEGLGR